MKRFAYHLLLVTALLLAAGLVSASAAPAHTSVSALRLQTSDSELQTMPSSTIRQQIVDEFKRRLAKIDSSAPPLANGYQYQSNIGKNTVDEWVTNYNENQLTSAQGKARIAVFDLTRTRDEKAAYDSGGVEATLSVQTRSYHLRDLAPTEVRKHLADMAQAIVTDPDTGERDTTLGGLVIDVQITDDGFVIPNDVFTIEASAIGWNVKHELDPYEV